MGIIRFIYAIAVVILHGGTVLGFTLLSRDLAVWSFFIISGFYMTLILNEKYVGKNGSYRLFITNRFLRIFPVYFVVLVLYGALSVFLMKQGLENPLHAYYSRMVQMGGIQQVLVQTEVFVRNITLIITPDYFFSNKYLPDFLFLSQAWTLQLELLFYLIAPFLARRRLRIVLLFTALLFLFDYSFVFPLHLFYQQPLIYRMFANFIFFFIGIISYHMYKKFRSIQKKEIFFTVFVCFILFTVFYNYLPLRIPVLKSPGHTDWLYYLSLAILIPVFFQLFKKSKLDNFIGELSYPIYISHGLIILLLQTYLSKQVTKDFFDILIIILTIGFSIILVYCIDKPIDKLRQMRITKP